ncbi:MAG: helix-turn-helix transcriptional regulator [Candidatus Edwardsbacteria bacterium]
MNLKKSLGVQIKSLRKAKGLTQEQLAERCNLSVHHISGIERGLHAPSLTTLENLSRTLDIPIREFFECPPRKKKTERERAIEILLKYLFKMKPSTVKFLTNIAKKLKNTK